MGKAWRPTPEHIAKKLFEHFQPRLSHAFKVQPLSQVALADVETTLTSAEKGNPNMLSQLDGLANEYSERSVEFRVYAALLMHMTECVKIGEKPGLRSESNGIYWKHRLVQATVQKGLPKHIGLAMIAGLAGAIIHASILNSANRLLQIPIPNSTI